MTRDLAEQLRLFGWHDGHVRPCVYRLTTLARAILRVTAKHVRFIGHDGYRYLWTRGKGYEREANR